MNQLKNKRGEQPLFRLTRNLSIYIIMVIGLRYALSIDKGMIFYTEAATIYFVRWLVSYRNEVKGEYQWYAAIISGLWLFTSPFYFLFYILKGYGNEQQ